VLRINADTLPQLSETPILGANRPGIVPSVLPSARIMITAPVTAITAGNGHVEDMDKSS